MCPEIWNNYSSEFVIWSSHNIRPKSRMRVTHQLSPQAALLRLLPLTLDHSWAGDARLRLTSLKSLSLTGITKITCICSSSVNTFTTTHLLLAALLLRTANSSKTVSSAPFYWYDWVAWVLSMLMFWCMHLHLKIAANIYQPAVIPEDD